jgi:hypothetical protein
LQFIPIIPIAFHAFILTSTHNPRK